jgi:hypothetical protein
VGQLVGRLVRPAPKRFLILSVGAVLCVYFAFAYASMIQVGSASTSDIVNLGTLLGLCFLSLGFLLPFTRVIVPNEIKILWSRAIEHFARPFEVKPTNYGAADDDKVLRAPRAHGRATTTASAVLYACVERQIGGDYYRDLLR